MTVARGYAELNGVPQARSGALAPYQGNPCAVLATGSDTVDMVLGQLVGVTQIPISARAVGARVCSLSYNVYGQTRVTYNGTNSTGGYIYAGDRFVYNGTGVQLTDVDADGCVDPLFNGIWVKSAGPLLNDVNDPIDSRQDLEQQLFECNGDAIGQNDPINGDEVSALPANVKNYGFVPPADELTALAYGDSLGLGPAAAFNSGLNTPAVGKPNNGGATGAACSTITSTSSQYFCTGSLPVSGSALYNPTLSIAGVTGPIGATGNVTSQNGNGPSRRTLTLAPGFTASVFAGGNISGLVFPNGYSGNIVADGNISDITVPDGYTGTIWAGGGVSNVTFGGAFEGEIISRTAALTGFAPTSCGSCFIWASSLGSGVVLPSGFTGSMYLGTTANTNLQLPSAFRGEIASRGQWTLTGQVDGEGGFATCGGDTGSDCGVVYSSSRDGDAVAQTQCSGGTWGGTETTSITAGSGGLVTNAYLWAPCGNIVLDNSNTRTVTPVIAFEVTYNGGSLAPVVGDDQFGNVGAVFLAE